MDSHYTEAAVCRRGHVISDNIKITPASLHCPECGAKVLKRCESCQTAIPGYLITAGRIPQRLGYVPPNFCSKCGTPLPWSSRTARIYELENILDEQEVDEATRLTIREQLEVLRSPDLSDEEQRERWLKIKKLAPGFLQAGRRIAETVITAKLKQEMGL